MVTLIYNLVDSDGNNIGSESTKQFESREAAWDWLLRQEGHPFLSIRVKEWK